LLVLTSICRNGSTSAEYEVVTDCSVASNCRASATSTSANSSAPAASSATSVRPRVRNFMTFTFEMQRRRH